MAEKDTHQHFASLDEIQGNQKIVICTQYITSKNHMTALRNHAKIACYSETNITVLERRQGIPLH